MTVNPIETLGCAFWVCHIYVLGPISAVNSILSESLVLKSSLDCLEFNRFSFLLFSLNPPALPLSKAPSRRPYYQISFVRYFTSMLPIFNQLLKCLFTHKNDALIKDCKACRKHMGVDCWYALAYQEFWCLRTNSPLIGYVRQSGKSDTSLYSWF